MKPRLSVNIGFGRIMPRHPVKAPKRRAITASSGLIIVKHLPFAVKKHIGGYRIMFRGLLVATRILLSLAFSAITIFAQAGARAKASRPNPKPPARAVRPKPALTAIVSSTTGALVVVAEPNTNILLEMVGESEAFEGTIPPNDRTFVFDDLKPGLYRVAGELGESQRIEKEVTIVVKKISTIVLNMSPNAKISLPQMGRYYALVIGNNAYQFLPRLKTAENDAGAVSEILREKYGFESKLLLNATRQQIIAALSEYRRKLEENANLLIYYAGHGYYDAETEKGYWLPVDATKEDLANWIIADDVTSIIKAIPAKHILIVSDSCYSGTIMRGIEISPTTSLGRSRQLQKLSEGKSRTLLASGGNEPVADGGGEGHSVFANTFLRALSQTDQDAFTAQEIFVNFISEAVTGRSNQTPEYNPIRNSGHVSGDFIFIRKRR